MIIIRNQKGVGLLELLVAVAIIALMSMLVAPNYANYKREKAMSFARTQISNNIRMTQSNTLSAVKLSGGIFPYGGYGIRFMKKTSTQSGVFYMLFADKTPVNGVYDFSNGESVEQVSLPSSITVSSMSIKRAGLWIGVDYADFVIVPPYGRARINNDDTITDLQITISNGARTENVILNNSGYVN
jgi:prepilin-type N-terminal cleavage/methylation domain-containing protein